MGQHRLQCYYPCSKVEEAIFKASEFVSNNQVSDTSSLHLFSSMSSMFKVREHSLSFGIIWSIRLIKSIFNDLVKLQT